MKNKFIKIHFDIKVFLSFLLIFLVGIGIVIAKYSESENCDSVDFEILSNSYTTEDLIEFKSIGDDGYKWEWDFGDGTNKKYVSNVLHKYDASGLYNITLKVNSSCKINRQIFIKEKVIVENINPELIPKVSFPDELRVGDIIEFSCTSNFANKWEWRFGESDKVDAISSETKYVFEEEGEHKISLIVNDDLKHAFIKTIFVLPKKENIRRNRRRSNDRVEDVLLNQIPDEPEVTVSSTEVEKIELSRKQAKKMIEDYASGNLNFEDIKQYFCSNNIKVINAKGKSSSLKNLLKSIRGKQIMVLDINLLDIKKTGCVNTLFIDMKIKGTFFWNKY